MVLNRPKSTVFRWIYLLDTMCYICVTKYNGKLNSPVLGRSRIIVSSSTLAQPQAQVYLVSAQINTLYAQFQKRKWTCVSSRLVCDYSGIFMI